VRAIHPLVPEILRDLVYTVIPADDEAFQIQLVSYPEIEVDAQSIVV
jgi:hypothetical protein